MKKFFGILFLSAAALSANAQDNPQQGDPVTVHTLAQMLRLQATISPAWSVTLLSGGDSVQSVSSGRTNVYIHGTAEYYWDERFSTRSDIYFLVNKNADPGGIKHNHGFQLGFSYHMIKRSKIDPFIGIRGGLNYTQVQPSAQVYQATPTESWTILVTPQAHIDPTWAPVIGCNFYGEKIFHFFIEGAYMMGMYRPAFSQQLSLEEFRVSAGLGWNISFYKPVDTVRQKI